ncbi:MAG: hypothetical protein JNM77_00150 [Pseudonocardia sp.]|nr:hypothetical protein [Pseudonocardia sp.]
MLTVVHVVGESDTGNTDLSQARVPGRRDRLRAWVAAVDAGDTELLRTGCLPGFPPPRFAATPLATVLSGVDADTVRLVLLATSTRTASVPTEPIAESLRRGLTACPTIFGSRVVAVKPLLASGFAEAAVAGLVRNALWSEAGPPGDAVLTWGSGSTSLHLAVAAGIVEAGVALRLRSSTAAGRDVTLAPRPGTAPLVPWLLRLGYPDQVGVLARRGVLDPPPGADVLAQAAEAARRLDRVGRGRGDATDLAEWVRGDVRRLDATAGMALRAWVEAEYRRRRADDGVLDLLDRARAHDSKVRTLGEVLGVLARAPADPAGRAAWEAPSGRWLRSPRVSRINRAARHSAHEAAPLSPRVLADLRAELPAPPGPLALPTGEVAVIWTAGTSGHAPYGDTLLSRPLGAALLRHCGRPPEGRLELSCLVLGTDEATGSLPVAREQVEALTAPGPHHAAVRARAVAVASRSETVAQEAVTAALAEVAPGVDAVVVVPIGPKELVLGALLAALQHGQARAVPVLLAGTDRAATEAEYHRVVPYLTADPQLARLAERALRRLELGTAARLCGIGSPRLQEVGTIVEQLDGWLWHRGAAGLRGRLALCAARLRPSPDPVTEPDRVRLVHVAAEIAQLCPRWPAVLRWLVEVRNDLVVSHGRPDGRVSVADAIAARAPRGRPPVSAPALIERAARACKAGLDDEFGARTYAEAEEALLRHRG